MTEEDCFQLTDDIRGQTGVVWSMQPLEVAKSFVIEVAMHFGSNDGPAKNGTNTSDDPGADGIAFVLQNQGPATAGRLGGGLGLSGIAPSLAVEIDTFQNFGLSRDTAEDHLALVKDGALAAGLQDGPYPLASNLEDGTFHNFTFEWKSDSSTLNVHLNGTIVMNSSLVDMSGALESDLAYLGFTSSTGHSSNVHEVCIRSIRGTVFETSYPTTASTEVPTTAPTTAPTYSPSNPPFFASSPSSLPSDTSEAPSCGKAGKAGKSKGNDGSKHSDSNPGNSEKSGDDDDDRGKSGKKGRFLRRLSGDDDDDDDDDGDDGKAGTPTGKKGSECQDELEDDDDDGDDDDDSSTSPNVEDAATEEEIGFRAKTLAAASSAASVRCMVGTMAGLLACWVA